MGKGSGFKIRGSKFRVQDSEFRVQGSGFRLCGFLEGNGGALSSFAVRHQSDTLFFCVHEINLSLSP